MLKKFFFFLASFFVVSFLNNVSAQQTQKPVQQIQKVSDSTIIVTDGAVVPRYNTYFMKTSTGKLIATFKEGQKVRLKKPNPNANVLNAGQVDCVIIPCPGSFGSQTTCWDCRPRPQ